MNPMPVRADNVGGVRGAPQHPRLWQISKPYFNREKHTTPTTDFQTYGPAPLPNPHQCLEVPPVMLIGA